MRKILILMLLFFPIVALCNVAPEYRHNQGSGDGDSPCDPPCCVRNEHGQNVYYCKNREISGTLYCNTRCSISSNEGYEEETCGNQSRGDQACAYTGTPFISGECDSETDKETLLFPDAKSICDGLCMGSNHYHLGCFITYTIITRVIN